MALYAKSRALSRRCQGGRTDKSLWESWLSSARPNERMAQKLTVLDADECLIVSVFQQPSQYSDHGKGVLIGYAAADDGVLQLSMLLHSLLAQEGKRYTGSCVI